MAKFSCIQDCNKSFKTEHGLRMHRITCKKFNYEDTDLHELARRLAAQQEARSTLGELDNVEVTLGTIVSLSYPAGSIHSFSGHSLEWSLIHGLDVQ